MKKFVYLFALSGLISCGTDNEKPDAHGNFEADEIILSSQIAGEVISSTVEEGDEVDQGHQLIQIDTTALYLQKNHIKARISALRQKLQDIPIQLSVYYERKNNLEREILRVKNLLEKGAATQKQFDDLTGELDVVKSQINAMKSQLSTANRGILAEIEPLQWNIRQIDHQIELSRIASPIKGTIINDFIEKGETASPGKPLVKLANLDRMVLRAYLSGDQLSNVVIGDEVSVIADGISEITGKLIWISSRAEFTPKNIQTREERVNQVYAVKVEVENKEGRLKIGMPGELKFK